MLSLSRCISFVDGSICRAANMSNGDLRKCRSQHCFLVLEVISLPKLPLRLDSIGAKRSISFKIYVRVPYLNVPHIPSCSFNLRCTEHCCRHMDLCLIGAFQVCEIIPGLHFMSRKNVFAFNDKSQNVERITGLCVTKSTSPNTPYLAAVFAIRVCSLYVRISTEHLPSRELFSGMMPLHGIEIWYQSHTNLVMWDISCYAISQQTLIQGTKILKILCS